MKERLAQLRKALNMSMETFGAKIGVGRSTISRLESGTNGFTDQMVKSICREFNVSFEWLTSGTGEMFVDMPQDTIDALCHEFKLDNLDRVIIQEYLRLDDNSRRILKTYVRRIAERVNEEDSQDQIDAEVEAYRADLEEEKNHADGSSASDTQLDA